MIWLCPLSCLLDLVFPICTRGPGNWKSPGQPGTWEATSRFSCLILCAFFLEPRTQEAPGAGGDPQVSAAWYHMSLPVHPWPAWSLMPRISPAGSKTSAKGHQPCRQLYSIAGWAPGWREYLCPGSGERAAGGTFLFLTPTLTSLERLDATSELSWPQAFIPDPTGSKAAAPCRTEAGPAAEGRAEAGARGPRDSRQNHGGQEPEC